jgi:transcriptional regulator with XRE-family HTH domain
VPSRKPPPSKQRQQFGRNLLDLREALGLTQEALAETINVDRRYIQGLEYGDYWPSLPVLSRLKEAFDCDWGDLLQGCEGKRAKRN